jgi:glycosyltransferase involved in cell wall biosynthesis
MIKIDIIYPRSLAAAIGPSQTIKRLINSRDIFLKHNIDLNVFYLNVKNFKGKTFLKEKIQNKILGSKRLYAYLYLIRSEFNTGKFIKNYCNKKRAVDIAVFHNVTAFIFFTMFNKNKSTKLVLFQHNNGDISDMGKKQFPQLKNSPHIKIIENAFFNRITRLDRIVFISNFAKNNFDSKHKTFKNKTATILNGIPDIDKNVKYNVKTKEPIKLITVGTVSKRKGQDIILRALANLDKNLLNNYHLTVVGEGPEYVQFKQLAADLNIEKNVQFVGEKEQHEVFEHLKMSSIFILMSHSEGLPLSILEALRFGLPIITTNVDGCPETVSNKNGFIINPDAAELTDIMKKININELKSMSDNSRELFEENYKFELFLEKYINLMVDL